MFRRRGGNVTGIQRYAARGTSVTRRRSGISAQFADEFLNELSIARARKRKIAETSVPARREELRYREQSAQQSFTRRNILRLNREE